MRVAALLAVVLIGFPAVARGAPVALLPAAGDPQLARELDQQLHGKLRAGGWSFVPPVQVQSRLWRAPGVANETQAARQAVARAQQLLLNLNRRGAVREARRAIALLVPGGGRHHAPRLFTTAQLTLAQALLLRPADEQGASSAVRAALDVSPELELDKLSPRVVRLIRQVRAEPRRSFPPTEGELASIAAKLEAGAVVWSFVWPRRERVELELLIYRPGRQSERVERQVTRGELVDVAARSIEAALGPGTAPASIPAVSGPPASAPASTAPSPATPWYGRWWVWAIAGAVVTGAAVGLAVGLTRDNEDAYTIRFNFRD